LCLVQDGKEEEVLYIEREEVNEEADFEAKKKKKKSDSQS